VTARWTGRGDWVYASHNERVSFADHRGHNQFSLLRLQVGFATQHEGSAWEHLDASLGHLRQRFKGELIDVSVPFQEDKMLSIYWADINNSMVLGTLKAGNMRTALYVEAVDELMREQSDLTFGPRMEQM